MYKLWAGPQNFCKNGKFVNPGALKSARAFGLLALFFSFFATIAGCIPACAVSDKAVSVALYATGLSFITLIFIVIEFGIFLRWSYIVSLLAGTSYIPLRNTEGDLIVVSLKL